MLRVCVCVCVCVCVRVFFFFFFVCVCVCVCVCVAFRTRLRRLSEAAVSTRTARMGTGRRARDEAAEGPEPPAPSQP